MEHLLQNRVRVLAPLEPRRTAILAIHWQVDVVGATGAFGMMFAKTVSSTGIVPRVAALLQAGRDAGALIVYVNVVYAPGHKGVVRNNGLFNAAVAQKDAFVVGTPGAAVIEELTPQVNDLVVQHSRISSFHGSDLLNMLIGHGIDTVALTGVATNVAVDHTARDAVQYGFRTLLVEDCCCTADPAYHEAAMMTLRVLSTRVLTAQELIDDMMKSKPT
jgi:nicotinamidase-related amidase